MSGMIARSEYHGNTVPRRDMWPKLIVLHNFVPTIYPSTKRAHLGYDPYSACRFTIPCLSRMVRHKAIIPAKYVMGDLAHGLWHAHHNILVIVSLLP